MQNKIFNRMRNHFYFKKFHDAFLLTNDTGAHIFLSDQEFKWFLSDPTKLPSQTQEILTEHQFLLQNIDQATDCMRLKKAALFHGPSLFIFVVTENCNFNCVYCQASSPHALHAQSMTKEIAWKAVDIALSSPETLLTFEFQGGEPLLNFPIIKEIVFYAESRKRTKQIQYALVSNLTLLNKEMISFFRNYHFQISTSLDGPKWLQILNRPSRKSPNSWDGTLKGVQALRKEGIPVGAILTTTRQAFNHEEEIIQAYINNGFTSIFIRPLTPLGEASIKWNEIGYTPEEYCTFYTRCLSAIELHNTENSSHIEEVFNTLPCSSISGDSEIRYTELGSPCGGGTGQMAFMYNGKVYTCDEGRMLGETGNDLFQMGTVNNIYKELITSSACKAVCSSSILEAIPECCSCVYQPYCGVCPVVNMALYDELIAPQAHGYHCTINKRILDDIFTRIYNRSLGKGLQKENEVEED